MHLKKGADIVEFLKRTAACQGEVLFCTKENDVLNLKSTLMRYIFVTLVDIPEILYTSEIICENSEDEKLLAVFLE